MVSDFIDEFSGYLRLSEADYERAKQANPEMSIPKEAREIIEYGERRDGYWTSEKFINQVKNAVQIADILYPRDNYTQLWLFDQSSNHKAMAPDALIAHKMNVTPGGKQPAMRDTFHEGNVQRMVFDDGTPKGLRRVLDERGVDTSMMKKKILFQN